MASGPPPAGALDLSDPDLYVEHGGAPHAYLAELRAGDPVHWAEPPVHASTAAPIHEGYWVVTRHADCVAALTRPSTFSSSRGGPVWWALDDDAQAGLRYALAAMDPPEHTRARDRIASRLGPLLGEGLEDALRAEARRLVAGLRDRRECDFARELAPALPGFALCELAGVPADERATFLTHARRLFGADDDPAPTPGAAQQAATELWLMLCDLAERQRDAPTSTLLGRCLEQARMDGPLTDVELNNLFLMLVAAGLEAPTHAASHCIRLLLEHPAARDRVFENPDEALPGAIEETLRFASPRTAVGRCATTDVTLGDARIRAGQRLHLSLVSANHDEAVFDDPMHFDVTRDPNPHLAFGAGPHECLGAELARMQLRALLREVAVELPTLAFAGPPRIQRSHLVAGIRELPVRW